MLQEEWLLGQGRSRRQRNVISLGKLCTASTPKHEAALRHIAEARGRTALETSKAHAATPGFEAQVTRQLRRRHGARAGHTRAEEHGRCDGPTLHTAREETKGGAAP